jgi:hypothetical protein
MTIFQSHIECFMTAARPFADGRWSTAQYTACSQWLILLVSWTAPDRRSETVSMRGLILSGMQMHCMRFFLGDGHLPC